MPVLDSPGAGPYLTGPLPHCPLPCLSAAPASATTHPPNASLPPSLAPPAPQEEVLPRVFKDWSISQLCFEQDTEPYARSRDAAVRQLAAAADVEVKSPVSHTLYVSA
jgi:hypothetical protein